jgi:hypothetical protein
MGRFWIIVFLHLMPICNALAALMCLELKEPSSIRFKDATMKLPTGSYELIRPMVDDSGREAYLILYGERRGVVLPPPGSSQLKESQWGCEQFGTVSGHLPQIHLNDISQSPPPTIAALGIKTQLGLVWNHQGGWERYRLTIYDEFGEKEVTRVTTADRVLLELESGQAYHWTLEGAPANREFTSERPSMETLPTFQISTYTPLALGVSEEPSQLYGWLRLDSSLLSYQGMNRDTNAVINQKIYGGTGEVALGYWHPQSNYGVLAQIAITGFRMSDQVPTYFNYGWSVGKRVKVSERSHLRVWLGYSYFQFPEIRSSILGGPLSIENIRTSGPQVQFSFLRDVTDRLGWHFATRVFHSIDGDSSVDFSLWATYRILKAYKAMFGYTYRLDRVRYSSFDGGGTSNTVSMNGHFISFRFEFGLMGQ